MVMSPSDIYKIVFHLASKLADAYNKVATPRLNYKDYDYIIFGMKAFP